MNKFNNIFGQILQIFSKKEFYEAVKETKADKGAIGQHNDKRQKYRGNLISKTLICLSKSLVLCG
jgi:hypothetical protein